MDTLRPYVLSLTGRAELRAPDGRLVPLPTRKTLLLLAVLAESAGTRLLRSEVARTVWDAADPKSARDGLRTALAALRKALPTDAIRADRDEVELREGVVESTEADEGEFMPGFDGDWSIERRLDRRATAVSVALASARRNGGSLAEAERACRIDPLDGEAAALRERLLREAGRGQDAVVLGDAHRARLLRELGVWDQAAPPAPPPTAEHPLVAAAEWTLARDPDEALALLAGTQSQWLTLAVDRALEIHERVLAVCHRPSRARQTAEIGLFSLQTLNGKVGDHPVDLEETYREALGAGEGVLAARLVDTLAYRALSKGDFGRALAFAREGVRGARGRPEATALAEALITLGIVQWHSGDLDSSHRSIEKSNASIEEVGSSYAIASSRNVLAGSLLAQGKVDAAARLLEYCQRAVETLGSDRLRPWVIHLESLLHERIGDAAAARDAAQRFQAASPSAGQSAVALADDSLLRIHCGLGELDHAAEAYARGKLYRGRLGTVPSLRERDEMSPALRILRDRLSPADLAAAFRRAGAEGATPEPARRSAPVPLR